jgi:ankyrin repeat protein
MRIFFFLSMVYAVNSNAMEQLVKAPTKSAMFMQAIKEDDRIAVESMITSDPTLLFEDGLHWAAKLGRNKCLNILLKRGADPKRVEGEDFTPLHCVKTFKSAQLLIQAGALVNAKNAFGNTPLSGVLFDKNRRKERPSTEWLDIAQLLVSSGANINVKSTKKRGTLLHDAVEHMNDEAANFLLCKGADTSKRNGDKLTAFELLIDMRSADIKQSSLLFSIFEKYNMLFFPGMSARTLCATPSWIKSDLPYDQHSVALISALAKLCTHLDRSGRLPVTSGVLSNARGCIVNKITYQDLANCFDYGVLGSIQEKLHSVVQYVLGCITCKNYEQANVALHAFPFVTTYCDVKATTMIMGALQQKECICLKVLIENKIDIHTRAFHEWKCCEGGTALHQAIYYNNPKAITLLMEAGVDCLEKNLYGETTMEYAVNRQEEQPDCVKVLNKEIGKLCIRKVMQCDYKKAKQLLAQMVDCNIMLNDYYSFLQELVQSNWVLYVKTAKMIPLLVAKGIDLNRCNKNGDTILYECVYNAEERLPITKALLQAGANVNKGNESPLRHAIHLKRFFLVPLFLEHGAIVKKEMMDYKSIVLPEDTKTLLQQKYDEQQCCVCFELPDDLSNIPCNGKHRGYYMCKGCYQGFPHIKQDDQTVCKICPICRGRMGEFGT